MTANEKQVGGEHYKSAIQHWDYAASHEFDYFQGQITKYVTRWKKKNGLQDLEKALHFLEKYIELQRTKLPAEDKPGTPKYLSKDGKPLSPKMVHFGAPFGYDPARELDLVYQNTDKN